jgi:hypothetical protein
MEQLLTLEFLNFFHHAELSLRDGLYWELHSLMMLLSLFCRKPWVCDSTMWPQPCANGPRWLWATVSPTSTSAMTFWRRTLILFANGKAAGGIQQWLKDAAVAACSFRQRRLDLVKMVGDGGRIKYSEYKGPSRGKSFWIVGGTSALSAKEESCFQKAWRSGS